MEHLITEAMRGFEKKPHMGDFILAEEAGARKPGGLTRIARGLFVSDNRDGTWRLRLHRGSDIRVLENEELLAVPEGSLQPEERDWVPEMRERLRLESRTAFSIPGNPHLTESILKSTSGILECTEAPDSTAERRRYVVFHDREPIGIFTRGGIGGRGLKDQYWIDLTPVVPVSLIDIRAEAR